MKKILAIVTMLLLAVSTNAQKHPKSIYDLQFFLGRTSTNLKKFMKRQGYPSHNKKDDKMNGPYLVQYYEGEAYEGIELYIKGNKVDAVGFSYFTQDEATKIVKYVKASSFKKICSDVFSDNAISDEAEAWQNKYGTYKIKVISENLFGSRKVKKIIISANSLIWDCETTYKQK